MKFLLLLLYWSPAFSVTPEEIVNSSLKHFPKVIESVRKLEEQKQLTQNARGAFDAKLKGEADIRSNGFYNGDAYKATLEKPFPFLNSTVYGGQRQGYGNFPGYEGKFETLNQGEVFAGLSVSLLRNALIDMNRYNLRFRKQEQVQAEVKLNLMKINIQTMALKSYWTWVTKGQELRVYQEILDLARTRDLQIRRRIKAGDLARIYRSENDQYLRKRQAQVIQSQMEFQEASYYLSLFYRNAEGKPRPVNYEMLPSLRNETLTKINDYNLVFKRAVEQNLDLQILNSKEKQARLDLALGKNDLLPKLDVNFEWNQDQGMGPNRLTQDENRVLLKLEIPIQYRKGLGKKRAAKAKLEQLDTRKQWTQEKLLTQVQSLIIKLNSFSEIFTLSNEQVNLAKKLAEAERRKFSAGASDLILVNIREENLAEAQIKNLRALLKYQFINADVKNIQVEFLN